MEKEISIKKIEAAEHQQLVFAEVYAPLRPDSGRDFMTAEEIQKMAYKFMKSHRLDKVDVMHDNQTIDGVSVVESFIARKGDPDFIPGAWVIGVHVPHEETWDKILKGELNGFSLEAFVMTEKMDIEVEVPPIVSGRTTVSADHEHKFHVAYDQEGNFLGGITDVVNNHQHVIKAGTFTESTMDHSHRFSAVDTLQVYR